MTITVCALALLGATTVVQAQTINTADVLVRRVDYTVSVDPSGDGVDVSARFDVYLPGPTGHLRMARSVAALLELKAGNYRLYSTVDLSRRQAQVFEAEQELIFHRTRQHLGRRILKDEASLFRYAPQRNIGCAHPVDADVAVQCASIQVRDEAGHAPGQCALATS